MDARKAKQTLRGCFSADSYPSEGPSPDRLLDELLGDIRTLRSRTTSQASTPTALSSDCDESPGLRDRSETELRGLDVADLRTLLEAAEQEVDCVSELLVRLLHVRDKRVGRLCRQFGKLTTILRSYAEENALPVGKDLKFSFQPPTSEEEYAQWLSAWKVMARLPKGIPKHWRKTLWSSLAARGTRDLDWATLSPTVFSEYSTQEDDALGAQIVKDLHRTGNTGFTTEEEHAILKTVLLAYARHNKSIGYCQGFNVIAALILKVVNFDEENALKVMVYLVDYILPENYFAQNLCALSADMAVFRDMLRHYVPELSAHIEELQKEASGLIKKSYSSENPPDQQSIHAYEPPLADVFTMQWFLTMFATALPRKATRRIWDAIFLDGSQVLLHTAIAILAVMERELLKAATAADFYATMAQLGEKLRKAQLLPSSEFMQIVYSIQDYAAGQSDSVPNIKKLREKYTYNIYPCAELLDLRGCSEEKEHLRPCPVPSRGGSFVTGGSTRRKKSSSIEDERGGSPYNEGEETEGSSESDTHSDASVQLEIKKLHAHYLQVAKQPSCIHCNMGLAPPQARAVCPQTKNSVAPAHYPMTYGADVPPDVLHESQLRSGANVLTSLREQRRKTFAISYTQPKSMLPRTGCLRREFASGGNPGLDYTWLSAVPTGLQRGVTHQRVH